MYLMYFRPFNEIYCSGIFIGSHWLQKLRNQLINILNSPQVFVYMQEDLHLNIGRQRRFPAIMKRVNSFGKEALANIGSGEQEPGVQVRFSPHIRVTALTLQSLLRK